MKRAAAAALLAVAVVAVIVAALVTYTTPVAAPTPTPTVTDVTATAKGTPAGTVPAPCRNDYQVGDTPLVPPRKSGRSAEVALDSVVVGPAAFGNATRWNVRAFNPTGSGGTFEMPLRATVRTSAGAEVAVLGYEVGPPNAGSVRATGTVVIEPCDPASAPGTQQRGKVLLIVHTAPITSGTYVLTLRDVKLPEGGTRDETWSVTLTCGAPDPGNPAGIRCQ